MKNLTWKEENNSLKKTLVFKDFQTAFAWMTHAAFIMEKMNHHAQWTNTYNRVELVLNTHDAGNMVTQKDWDLAEALDKI